MRRVLSGFSLLVGALAATSAHPLGGQRPTAAPPDAAAHRAFLDRYCITCHDDTRRTAGLTLAAIDVEHVGQNAAVWENVVRKLRTGAMPPPAVRPRPAKTTADAFASWAETELDLAAAAHPNPGRPVIRRLNRAEYANAIRDLLAIDIDVESLLPSDDSGYGFDNIGDVLTVSPTLLERYMSTAARVSGLAVGDPAIGVTAKTFTLSPRLVQDDRMDEDLPFGTRGGISIHHYFPLDAEYLVKIRLKRDRVNDIIGLARPHVLDVRLDGARVKEFTVGGEKKDDKSSKSTNVEESYERTADAALELRLRVKAGPRVIGISFLNSASAPEGALKRRVGLQQYAQEDDIPAVGNVTIGGPYNATGPGDTPSRRRILVCRLAGRPENTEVPCARRILSTLAHRAYRGPVTGADIETLLDFYRIGKKNGGVEAGVRLAIQRMLVSPRFLFRLERDAATLRPFGATQGRPEQSRGTNVPAGAVHRLSDVELASRLSFFLWSSMPDDELLRLAERGRLKEAAVLQRQVRRMLADARSKALIRNFAGQWLHLRKMQKVAPDPEEFPEFDENLRQAFQQQSDLFLESILREDRSVLDLLDADYTFLNERLARHYQIPGVYGSHFRRVTLQDEARRGLTGQGAVLTVTSYASRTSPTLRGKWLLENILGTPPPLPPNNVPALKDRGEDGRVLSVRQQMEEHAKNPGCASCHVGMDPLGFALENFDAIGRWRTTSGGNVPIDAVGVLPDGARFQGPTELRKLLLSRRDELVDTVIERLVTYALGRGLEYYDAPSIRAIKREAAATNYRWSSIILAIVGSTPFQVRSAREP